jgi:proline dehydrogenase
MSAALVMSSTSN